MKAVKIIGNGITGVNVYFSIGDLVNIQMMIDGIMRDVEVHEENSATALARVMHKITSGGLDLEQSSKELHKEEDDIFEADDESNDEAESTFEEREAHRKTMVGVLIDLEAKIPQLKVVKDEENLLPGVKIVGKLDLEDMDTQSKK